MYWFRGPSGGITFWIPFGKGHIRPLKLCNILTNKGSRKKAPAQVVRPLRGGGALKN